MKKNWFNSNNKILFIIIFLAKGALTLFTIFHEYKSNASGTFAFCNYDFKSYIEPIENLVNSGAYIPDYRMPGYGVMYLPLFIFFSQAIALNILVIIQLILDVIASYLFIKSIWLLTLNRNVTLAGLIFYGFGCTITVYNNFILTESVSASLLIFSLYCLINFTYTEKKNYLFLASLFITWSYFCRPIFFSLFLIQFIYVILISIKGKKYINIFLFFMPFMLIQGSWTLRNYIQKNKLYLLTETAYDPCYSNLDLACWEFSKTFDDIKGSYFFPDKEWNNRSTKLTNIDSVKFPMNIYTPSFNEDSLKILRNIAKLIVCDTVTFSNKQVYKNIFTEKIKKYTQSIKSNHFALVYIETPLKRLFKHTIKASGVQFLFIAQFSKLTLWEKIFKLFFILIYQIAFYSAIFFIVKLFIVKNKPIFYVLGICCVYGLTIHPIFIGTSDVRYLYSFYPLIAFCGTLFYSSNKKTNA